MLPTNRFLFMDYMLASPCSALQQPAAALRLHKLEDEDSKWLHVLYSYLSVALTCLSRVSVSIRFKKVVIPFNFFYEFEYAELFSPMFYFANQRVVLYLSRIVSILLTVLQYYSRLCQ